MMSRELACALTPPSPVAPAMSAWTERLADCLETETSLLERLEEVLLSQREAVERDDLQAVEDDTHAARKILRTLAEAKKHRSDVLEAGTENPELPLAKLESHGIVPDTRLDDARAHLQATARRVQGTLSLNQHLLSGASAANDRGIRALLGPTPRATWSPHERTHAGSAVDGGRHLNRTV